ncbi:hypothetical protein TNCV_2875321 [Trichonephila clavipes]|nr:hypothetical protein TNCV_2875321 [Trichonephila clavipes]
MTFDTGHQNRLSLTQPLRERTNSVWDGAECESAVCKSMFPTVKNRRKLNERDTILPRRFKEMDWKVNRRPAKKERKNEIALLLDHSTLLDQA